MAKEKIEVIRVPKIKIIPDVKKDPNYHYRWVEKKKYDQWSNRGYEKVVSDDKVLGNSKDGKSEGAVKECREMVLMRTPMELHEKNRKLVEQLTKQRSGELSNQERKDGLKGSVKIRSNKTFIGKSIRDDEGAN